jgi:N-acyl amino acid synthase of PEP-CTERM/exosortase system
MTSLNGGAVMNSPGFGYNVIDNPERQAHLLEAIYRLRYQVYVNEWGFERPEDHLGGVEMDEYDNHSKHFYAYSGEELNVIGTARIILGSDLPFPIVRHFAMDAHHLEIPRDRIAEISRLAISKDYRRRAIDRVLFSRDNSTLGELEQHQIRMQALEHERRKCEHELIRGIYLLIYRESLRLGLTHWYAVMARGLQVILHRWGIEFQQIGPEQNYHGVRAPYLLSISELTRVIAARNPELLKLAHAGA